MDSFTAAIYITGTRGTTAKTFDLSKPGEAAWVKNLDRRSPSGALTPGQTFVTQTFLCGADPRISHLLHLLPRAVNALTVDRIEGHRRVVERSLGRLTWVQDGLVLQQRTDEGAPRSDEGLHKYSAEIYEMTTACAARGPKSTFFGPQVPNIDIPAVACKLLLSPVATSLGQARAPPLRPR